MPARDFRSGLFEVPRFFQPLIYPPLFSVFTFSTRALVVTNPGPPFVKKLSTGF